MNFSTGRKNLSGRKTGTAKITSGKTSPGEINNHNFKKEHNFLPKDDQSSVAKTLNKIFGNLIFSIY